MKVYAFQYCSCIYESAFAVQSLHTTKKGAYLAMRKFLIKENEEFYEMLDMFKRTRREHMKDPDYKYKGQYRQWKFMEHTEVRISTLEVTE